MRTTNPLANLGSGNMGTHPPVQPGRTSQVHVVISEDEYKEQMFKLALDTNQFLKRIREMAYDYKNPVDEWAVIGTNASALPNGITINTDYDQTVRYSAILYSLPLGTTSATLSIGTDRVIQLYSGTPLAVQQPVILPHLNMLAVANDKRNLTLAGALTTTGYISLMGHCFEREGDR